MLSRRTGQKPVAKATCIQDEKDHRDHNGYRGDNWWDPSSLRRSVFFYFRRNRTPSFRNFLADKFSLRRPSFLTRRNRFWQLAHGANEPITALGNGLNAGRIIS